MKKLIMLYFFLAGGIAANAKNIDYTYLKMQSAPFEVDDDYLSKHDIVYFSPTQLEAEGFPMGNGDIGGMVWNHDNGIELQINKNDLWTKAQPEEYGMSLLRHAARLKIDFGAPVFSWVHLEEFEGGYRWQMPRIHIVRLRVILLQLFVLGWRKIVMYG